MAGNEHREGEYTRRIRAKPYRIRSATMMSRIPLHGSLQHTMRAKSSNRQSTFLWALHHEINTIQFKMQISFEIIFCFYLGRTKSPALLRHTIPRWPRRTRQTHDSVQMMHNLPRNSIQYDTYNTATDTGLGKLF